MSARITNITPYTGSEPLLIIPDDIRITANASINLSIKIVYNYEYQ